MFKYSINIPQTPEKPSACWATSAGRGVRGYKRKEAAKAQHGFWRHEFSRAFKEQAAKLRAPSTALEGCQSRTGATVQPAGAFPPPRPSSASAGGGASRSHRGGWPASREQQRARPASPHGAPGPAAPRSPSRRLRPGRPRASQTGAASRLPAPAKRAAAEGASRTRSPSPAPFSGARPPGRADGGCSWAPPPEDYRSQGAAGGLCQVAVQHGFPIPAGAGARGRAGLLSAFGAAAVPVPSCRRSSR